VVVGDDHAGELGGQICGLRDHPHAGFGAAGAANHTADVVGIDHNLGAGALLSVEKYRVDCE
jgi:hypothetical protein